MHPPLRYYQVASRPGRFWASLRLHRPESGAYEVSAQRADTLGPFGRIYIIISTSIT